MYEIIDNFLTEEKFLKVKNSILNSEFSWNLTPWVSNLNENLKTTSSYYFTHVFYSGLYVDPNSHIFIDILNQLKDLYNQEIFTTKISHLKEKYKPRYDKEEAKIWYE